MLRRHGRSPRWSFQRPSWRVLPVVLAFATVLLPLGNALAKADPSKVIRWYFPTGEAGFDPCRVTDLYSNTVNEAIFERLLTYDYLARPAKLVPMAALAAPKDVLRDADAFVITISQLIHCGSWTPSTVRNGRSCSKAR